MDYDDLLGDVRNDVQNNFLNDVGKDWHSYFGDDWRNDPCMTRYAINSVARQGTGWLVLAVDVIDKKPFKPLAKHSIKKYVS